jgi:iron complex outermembrane receptor protein
MAHPLASQFAFCSHQPGSSVPARLGASALKGAGWLALLALIPLQSARAQATAESAADGRGAAEILVTARVIKMDVPLAEVPQTVTTLSADLIATQNAVSVEEALRYVPSVQAELAGRSGFDELLIRGFSQSRYQFRDGLRLDPGYLQQQEVYGLASIEVLKGPASVLYGQIAPGGLVNFASKLAGQNQRNELGVSLGNQNLVRVFGDLGTSFGVDDSVSVRLPFLYGNRDDTEDFVGAERFFAAPSISFAPGADTRISIFALYQRDEYRRTLGLPNAGGLFAVPEGPLPRRLHIGEPGIDPLVSDQWQLGYLLEHKFGSAITVRSRLRYSDFQLNGPIVQAPRPGSTATNVTRRGFVFRGDRNLLATDNQAEAVFTSGSIEHRVMVGIDYQTYADGQAGDLFGLSPINPYAPVYGAVPVPLGPFFGADGRITQLGLYGQYRAKIADRLIVLGGVRYAETTNRNTDTLSGTTRRQDDKKATFNAAVLYTAPGGFSPYISFAQSFEPQVGNDPLPGGGIVPPSLGEQFEAGLRWQSPDQKLLVQAAVFQIDQTNIVNGDPANPGFSVLIGAQRHRGAEIEVNGEVVPGFRLIGGYSLLDAEIRRSNNGDAGLTPLNVPRHSASLFATIGGLALGLPDSDGSIGIRHVGQRRANDALDQLPAFTVVDAALRHRFGPITAQINIKNLFNKFYLTGASFRSVFPGEARTVQATVRYGF